MENDTNNRYESIEINSSSIIEKTFLQIGASFYAAVLNAERIDELELLRGIIVEYSGMTSVYGEQTGRIPESIAVDLSESVLMKLDALSQNDGDNEWKVYLEQFKDSLLDVSDDLDIDISFE